MKGWHFFDKTHSAAHLYPAYPDRYLSGAQKPYRSAFVGARNGLSALRRSCPLSHLWQHDGDKADRGRKERFQESIFLMFAPLM